MILKGTQQQCWFKSSVSYMSVHLTQFKISNQFEFPTKNYWSFQLVLPDCRPITYFEQIFAEIWPKQVREISRNYFCIILNSNLCPNVKKWYYKHKQVGSTSILTPDQMI